MFKALLGTPWHGGFSSKLNFSQIKAHLKFFFIQHFRHHFFMKKKSEQTLLILIISPQILLVGYPPWTLLGVTKKIFFLKLYISPKKEPKFAIVPDICTKYHHIQISRRKETDKFLQSWSKIFELKLRPKFLWWFRRIFLT